MSREAPAPRLRAARIFLRLPLVLLLAAAPAAAAQSNCGQLVYSEDFESGAPGWTGTGHFTIGAVPCASFPACMQGNVASMQNTGFILCHCVASLNWFSPCEGTLTSPPIQLPLAAPGESLVLDACLYSYVDGRCGFDFCNRLEIFSAQQSSTFALSASGWYWCPPPHTSPPYDITHFQGQSVQLRWLPACVDGEGRTQLAVDNVKITLFPSGPDCNDNLVPDACDIELGTSQDCNGNGVPDECDIASGTSVDHNGDGVPDECQCTQTHFYCQGGLNGVGRRAMIDYQGSASITENMLVLTVQDAVPDQFGLFFYGSSKTSAPFGGGTLCVTGGQTRLDPPVQLSPLGAGSYAVDFSLPPASMLQPLSQPKFQFWYRDPQLAGSSFNLSNALALHLCP